MMKTNSQITNKEYNRALNKIIKYLT